MLKRDRRGDVVIAARLRPGKHDAEVEWLDKLADENPDASVQDIIVWLINKARGESHNLTMPYDERYAQEALRRIDKQTRHTEELVTTLVGQIRASGGQVVSAGLPPDDPDTEDAGRQNALSARMAGLSFGALKR